MAVAGCAADAHHDGTGHGGVADGSLTHGAGACRRRGGGHPEGVCRAPGRAAVGEGAGCPQGPRPPPWSPPRWWTTFSFWRAPGQPQAVLAWEQAHLPRRFTPEDADFGPPSWDRTFSLSPIPGVLNARDLVVEVAGAGNGQTAIRVDAQVSWQPPRPAAERVPSAARVVTITQLPSLDPHASRPPAPVTITGLAVVRRLAALVDSLQLSTIGPAASCPPPPGGGIQLTFLARVGRPAARGRARPGRLRHRAVQRRRQAAARAADHRLVHPAGPQARRPELESPVGHVASRCQPSQRLAGHDLLRDVRPEGRRGGPGQDPPRTAYLAGTARSRRIPRSGAPLRPNCNWPTAIQIRRFTFVTQLIGQRRSVTSGRRRCAASADGHPLERPPGDRWFCPTVVICLPGNGRPLRTALPPVVSCSTGSPATLTSSSL